MVSSKRSLCLSLLLLIAACGYVVGRVTPFSPLRARIPIPIRRELTAEEARVALIQLIPRRVDEVPTPVRAMAAYFVVWVGEGQLLKELREAVPTPNEVGIVHIGRWTCDLKQGTFCATASNRVERVSLNGRFEVGAKNRWRARVTGASRAEFAR
jgi:hypothetical protein